MTQVDIVKNAYATLLQLPLGGAFRLRLQGALGALRDTIADATKRSAEDVQNDFEDQARAKRVPP